jgi:transcription antitermination factor NusG
MYMGIRAKEEHAEPLSKRSWQEVNIVAPLPEGPAWYLGFSTHDSDARAIKGLENGGYEVYYPKTYEVRKVPKNKLSPKQRRSPFAVKAPILVPMFPRYLFIRFSLFDGQWHEVFDLMGIKGMVCQESGGRPLPAPVADAAIDVLRSREDNKHAIRSEISIRQLAYDVGEVVRVAAGPFAMFNATVEELPDVPISELDSTCRLKLLVHIFGRETPVEMELGDIEKL